MKLMFQLLNIILAKHSDLFQFDLAATVEIPVIYGACILWLNYKIACKNGRHVSNA